MPLFCFYSCMWFHYSRLLFKIFNHAYPFAFTLWFLSAWNSHLIFYHEDQRMMYYQPTIIGKKSPPNSPSPNIWRMHLKTSWVYTESRALYQYWIQRTLFFWSCRISSWLFKILSNYCLSCFNYGSIIYIFYLFDASFAHGNYHIIVLFAPKIKKKIKN